MCHGTLLINYIFLRGLVKFSITKGTNKEPGQPYCIKPGSTLILLVA